MKPTTDPLWEEICSQIPVGFVSRYSRTKLYSWEDIRSQVYLLCREDGISADQKEQIQRRVKNTTDYAGKGGMYFKEAAVASLQNDWGGEIPERISSQDNA